MIPFLNAVLAEQRQAHSSLATSILTSNAHNRQLVLSVSFTGDLALHDGYRGNAHDILRNASTR